MSFYIEDQITGLVDGYYAHQWLAEDIAEGLNLWTNEHLFLVKNAQERSYAPISECEFLGSCKWFLDMVSRNDAFP